MRFKNRCSRQIRAFLDIASAETTRPPVDLSDEPSREDLEFTLVEMLSQTLESITVALARLHAGDCGISTNARRRFLTSGFALYRSRPSAWRARRALTINGTPFPAALPSTIHSSRHLCRAFAQTTHSG
jgi:hypothetical protein